MNRERERGREGGYRPRTCTISSNNKNGTAQKKRENSGVAENMRYTFAEVSQVR